MPDELPPEFYDWVDRFIDVANELTRKTSTERVSAVIMFAAAQYNAHCMLAVDPNAQENREDAIAYFVKQYRSMLEDNIDWLTHIQAQGKEGDSAS